jgi:hypothetical protein
MATLSAGPEYVAALEHEWEVLSHPGTWFTGDQRVAIAREARAARDGLGVNSQSLSEAARSAARAISATPAAIRATDVQGWYNDGLTGEEYIEILGIVARLSAIDTFLFGLGQPGRPLPEPIVGEPTRHIVAEARLDGGWAPTVGFAFPTTALSAVPAEHDAMADLAAAFYIALDGMADLALVDGLQRDQMEVVAARTSLINDCFF